MSNFHYFTITIAVLAMVSSLANASDPSPLQDFCVAVNDSKAAGIYFSLNFSQIEIL